MQKLNLNIAPTLVPIRKASNRGGDSAKLNFPDEAISRNQAFNDLHYESDIVTLTTSHPAQAITGTSYINKFPDFMKASPVPADLESRTPPSPSLSSHYNFPRSGHDSNLNPLDTSERVTPSQFSSLSQQTLSPLPSPYNPVCNMENPISSTSVNAWNINGLPQQVGLNLGTPRAMELAGNNISTLFGEQFDPTNNQPSELVVNSSGIETTSIEQSFWSSSAIMGQEDHVPNSLRTKALSYFR